MGLFLPLTIMIQFRLKGKRATFWITETTSCSCLVYSGGHQAKNCPALTLTGSSEPRHSQLEVVWPQIMRTLRIELQVLRIQAVFSNMKMNIYYLQTNQSLLNLNTLASSIRYAFCLITLKIWIYTGSVLPEGNLSNLWGSIYQLKFLSSFDQWNNTGLAFI